MMLDPCSRRRCSSLLLRGVVYTGSIVVLTATAVHAASLPESRFVAGIPVDFILFGLTLLGVALFHHRTLDFLLDDMRSGGITTYADLAPALNRQDPFPHYSAGAQPSI